MGPSLGEGDNKHLEAILLLLHTGMKHFKNVKYSYLANSVAVREHKNSRRLPHNTLPYDCKVYVVTFLQNYAEENAILLQGISEMTYMQLLPSNTTKKVYIALKTCYAM